MGWIYVIRRRRPGDLDRNLRWGTFLTRQHHQTLELVDLASLAAVRVYCRGHLRDTQGNSPSLDQPGRAEGSLINGKSASRSPPRMERSRYRTVRRWDNVVSGDTPQRSVWTNGPGQPDLFDRRSTISTTRRCRLHALHLSASAGERRSRCRSLLPSPAATRTSLRRPWGGKKQQKTKELKKKTRK